MIEMRWLDAPLMQYEGPPLQEGMSLTIPRRQILQFRVLDEEVTWHGKAGPIRHRAWSAWQDVPTVRYEDLPSPSAARDERKE